MEKHNCGGNLKRQRISVTRVIDGIRFTYSVVGKKCTRCSEEVISRDTARALEDHKTIFEEVRKREGRWYLSYE